MDINFSLSADLIVMPILGVFIAPDTVWSDGVSQQQYDKWCMDNHSPSHDIRAVSWMPTKKEIVCQLYWLPYARLLPPGADYLFLDAAWLLSVKDAIVILQRTVGAPPTGMVDDATKLALGKLILPLDYGFVSAFCDAYEDRFSEVVTPHPPEEARLNKWWINRSFKARENAITVIRAGMK